jgi:SAM-dependent methyltransferase
MDSPTSFDGKTYQSRINALAEKGIAMHGEADFIRTFHPASVLDAGCGTGRVAIELSRHGIDVVGVDIDASMIAEAMHLAPSLEWVQADLATLSLGREFEVVVLAGNVPLFCPEPARRDLVATCAAHVVADGLVIAGFQLHRGYELSEFDRACAHSGLELVERWATWDREPSRDESEYVVSVHKH